MAVAYDQGGGAAAASAAASVSSTAWTCSGSDRLCLGGMGWLDWSAGASVSMKWGGSGGTAMSQVGTDVNSADYCFCAMYQITAPNTGSYTLYGSVENVSDVIFVVGATWTGVDQGTPINSSNSAVGVGTAPSVTITSAAGEYVQDVLHSSYSNTATQDVSQTLIWKALNILGEGSGGGSYESAGASSTVMSWTTQNDDYAIMGASIKAAAAGGDINIYANDLMQRMKRR